MHPDAWPDGDTPDANTHRVTHINNRSYAVTDPEKHFASGRAEDSIFFHKTVAQRATVL
jgi:hypothetical protein